MSAAATTSAELALIAAWATNAYFPDVPVSAERVRSLTNDVYIIRAANTRYALKVYGAGWRTVAAVAWEVSLLAHLRAHDVAVAVAVAVPDQDGETVRTFTCASGPPRLAVLFEWAPGSKPQPPFSPALYHRVGRAVAAMHSASDSFASSHHRDALDVRYLIDEPIAGARELVTPADWEFLCRLGEDLRGRIATLERRGLDRGPVHGDLTLDNLHRGPDASVVLYDFDSGGPGYRACDLQGWTALTPGAQHTREAFLDGYASVRTLSDADVLAAPYLHGAFEVWALDARFLTRLRALNDERAVSAYVDEQLRRLRAIAPALQAL